MLAIEILKSMKEFRVDDELPFNTVDYLNIDTAIEELAALEAERDLEAGSAPLRVEHAKRTFRALAIELINRYSASFSEAERIAALAVVDAFEVKE